MFKAICISALAIVSQAQYAAIINGNNNNSITASFVFTAANSGVNVMISGTGLNMTAAGNAYHVHVTPVLNNDCTTTGGHFDPYGIGSSTPTPGNLTTYQVGDLAGKWGVLNGTSTMMFGPPAALSYNDPTLSFTGTNSIVGRSVVIHMSGAATRIACANILPYTMPTATPMPSAGAASHADMWSIGGLMAALALVY